MPIDVEELAKKGTEVIKGPSKKTEVVAILKKKEGKSGKRQAFSQAEIAEALGIRPQYARSILMGLVEAGDAERKQVSDGKRNKIFYAWAGK